MILSYASFGSLGKCRRAPEETLRCTYCKLTHYILDIYIAGRKRAVYYSGGLDRRDFWCLCVSMKIEWGRGCCEERMYFLSALEMQSCGQLSCDLTG